APPGANPVAVVQRVLANTAQQKLALGPPGAVPAAAAAPRMPTLGAPGAAPAAAAQRMPTLGPPGAAPAAARSRCRCGQPWNCTCGQSGQSGRWVRRGRDIVIINCQQLRQGHTASLQAKQRL